jgi:nucleoid-associated protein YgaU
LPRLPHGQIPGPQAVKASRDELARLSAEVPLGFALTPPVDVHDFDFMFPTLQANPDNLLPTSAATVAALKQLGRTMVDEDVRGEDSPIPAAYTYFGQFVDHDITLEVQPADIPESASGSLGDLLADDMVPLAPAQIRNALRNFRSATVDLDSVYGLPAPRDPNNGAKMRLGTVTAVGNRPPGKTDDNDLPREPPREGNDLHDRAALIGDPRNDENLIVAQLHVAFLKAHNELVDQQRSFEEAQRLLRQHYQHIVIFDFLRKRVVGSNIVDDILLNGNRWFNALGEPFFMPLEFANAAYRFGHTMVRAAYNFNLNFNFADDTEATLELLFTFTALSGQNVELPTLPENWIIEWENLIGDDPGVGKARRIDTKLAAIGGRALFALTNLIGEPEEPQPDASRLAVRNLLRGYRLRIPTGQAVANLLELPVMTAAEIEAAATSPEQVQALQAGGFSQRTPLWYYILAEAKHHGGSRLGPVGGTIVAEVLIGLIRRSEDSILRSPGWFPSLPQTTPGVFELQDLLRFAGVLPQTRTPGPRLYTVRAGDTLSRIARDQLGNADRWPEIFVLNRAIIRHPDRIFPGQVLTLPSTPITPRPRIYVVRRGDTLSGIARARLRNADRWPEIFALNRDILSDPNRIIPDQVLLLPPN